MDRLLEIYRARSVDFLTLIACLALLISSAFSPYDPPIIDADLTTARSKSLALMENLFPENFLFLEIYMFAKYQTIHMPGAAKITNTCRTKVLSKPYVYYFIA